MPSRLALAAVAAAVLSTAGAATAAPSAAACNLVHDPAGDGWLGGYHYVPSQPSHDTLDILSADVATTDKYLVAVIRLKTFPSATDVASLGAAYSFFWTSGKVTNRLTYSLDSTTGPYAEHDSNIWGDGPTYPAQVRTDPSAGTITMWVPRRTVGGPMPRGGKLTDLEARSSAGLSYGGDGSTVPAQLGPAGHVAVAGDQAFGSRAYVDGTRSCVRMP